MPRPAFEQNWTDAEREQAQRLLRLGHSSSEVGAALHRSRNSIESRIHRDADLRIAREAGILIPRKPKPRPKKAAAAAIEGPPASFLVSAAVVAPPPPCTRPEPPLPPARPKLPRMFLVPLPELRADECHWPAQDAPKVVGGVRYCAARVARPGATYCAYHEAVRSGKPVDDGRAADG